MELLINEIVHLQTINDVPKNTTLSLSNEINVTTISSKKYYLYKNQRSSFQECIPHIKNDPFVAS